VRWRLKNEYAHVGNLWRDFMIYWLSTGIRYIEITPKNLWISLFHLDQIQKLYLLAHEPY
jgi:hypothetical protein